MLEALAFVLQSWQHINPVKKANKQCHISNKSHVVKIFCSQLQCQRYQDQPQTFSQYLVQLSSSCCRPLQNHLTSSFHFFEELCIVVHLHFKCLAYVQPLIIFLFLWHIEATVVAPPEMGSSHPEVRFVPPVIAGGSVKFLPMV